MSGKKRWMALAGIVGAIVIAIVAIQLIVSPEDPETTTVEAIPSSDTDIASETVSSGQQPDGDQPPEEEDRPPRGPVAANFTGITKWLNSEPLSLPELKGRVVLVDFWTYTCINCIRTLPYLRDWQDKYAGNGLVIVGVHSPEFDFEKEEAKVREAIALERVTWPVAMDNDFRTWRAYKNRYWPHKFLIDQDGYVRYHHIGEGAYDVTESKIRELLEEAGNEVSHIASGGVTTNESPGATTRELYAGLGWASGNYLGNDGGRPVPGQPTVFSDPKERDDGRFYLDGTWVLDSESARHDSSGEGSEGYLALEYTAAVVNAVVRPNGTEPVVVLVTLNGGPVPESARGDDIKVDTEGMTYFQVDASRLYNLVRSEEVGTHELKLDVSSPDFVLYTFTFGA